MVAGGCTDVLVWGETGGGVWRGMEGVRGCGVWRDVEEGWRYGGENGGRATVCCVHSIFEELQYIRKWVLTSLVPRLLSKMGGGENLVTLSVDVPRLSLLSPCF